MNLVILKNTNYFTVSMSEESGHMLLGSIFRISQTQIQTAAQATILTNVHGHLSSSLVVAEFNALQLLD